MEEIGVGIVGYGYAGRKFHAYLIGLTEGLRVEAVATRSPERQAQARADGVGRVYSTLEEMLRDEEVRLVVIATPHNTHAELALQAMEAGRHVVVDKIMCMTLAEAKAMLEASRRQGVLLSVFHNRRWDGDFLTVRHLVACGALGRPFRYETAIHAFRPQRGWRAQRETMGSLLFDWGAHLVDQALQLVAAPPQRVYCLTQPAFWEGLTIESLVHCAITFADGTHYIVEICNRSRAPRPRWFILGTEGAFVKYGLDPQEAAMVAGNIFAAREDPVFYGTLYHTVAGQPAETRIETLRGDWTAYYRNIAGVLLRGEELAVKPEEMLPQMAIMEAALESARAGREVALEGTFPH